MDGTEKVRTEKLYLYGSWDEPSTRIDDISSFENETRGDQSLDAYPSDETREGPAVFSDPSTGSAFHTTNDDNSSQRYSCEREINRILAGVHGLEYVDGIYRLKELKMYEQRGSVQSEVNDQFEPTLELSTTGSAVDLVLAARNEFLGNEVACEPNRSLESVLNEIRSVDQGTDDFRRNTVTGNEQRHLILPTDQDLCEARGPSVAYSIEGSNEEEPRGMPHVMTEEDDDITSNSFRSDASEGIVDEYVKSSRIAGDVTRTDFLDYLSVESIWGAHSHNSSHDPFDDVMAFTTCFDYDLKQSAIVEALHSIKKRLPDLPSSVPVAAEVDPSDSTNLPASALVDEEVDTPESNEIENSYQAAIPERAWSDDPFDDIFYFTTEFDFQVDQQKTLEALQSITNRLKEVNVQGRTLLSDTVMDTGGVNRDQVNAEKHESEDAALASVQPDSPENCLDDKLVVGLAQSHSVHCIMQEPPPPQLFQRSPADLHSQNPASNHMTRQCKSNGRADVLSIVTNTRSIIEDEAGITAKCKDALPEVALQTGMPDSAYASILGDGIAPSQTRLPLVSQQTSSDILGLTSNQIAIISAPAGADRSTDRPSSDSYDVSSSNVDALPERVWSVDPFDDVFYFTTDLDFEIDQDHIQAALHSVGARLEEGKVCLMPELEREECANPSEATADGTKTDFRYAHSHNVDITKKVEDVTIEANLQPVDPDSGVAPTLVDAMKSSNSVRCHVRESNDVETRNVNARVNANVEHPEEGIVGELSLRQKANQGKLARFLHYLQDALVDTSVLSGFDDSEVLQVEASDTLSKPSSHESDGSLLETSSSRSSMTDAVSRTTGTDEQFSTTQVEPPSSNPEIDSERIQPGCRCWFGVGA